MVLLLSSAAPAAAPAGCRLDDETLAIFSRGLAQEVTK
jgi:hypothetical protein